MIRLRSVTVLAALIAAAASVVSASPAAAADAAAACDPALPAGLTWSAPSSVAWGREVRVGANVLDALEGPSYEEDSVAFGVDAGKIRPASDPIAHDFEFEVKAPASGAALAASATWLMTDDTDSTRCAQSVALSIPTDAGDVLRYSARRSNSGITWSPVGAGNCHDVAIEPVSLTVQQGGVTRRLTAPDQCDPSGAKHASTRDWKLSIGDGTFRLTALTAHSSLRTRMRYVVRVGSRRVASGSLALVRTYVPDKRITWPNPAFFSVCIHGMPHKMIANGCIVAGSLKLHLTLV